MDYVSYSHFSELLSIFHILSTRSLSLEETFIFSNMSRNKTQMHFSYILPYMQNLLIEHAQNFLLKLATKYNFILPKWK